MHNVQPVLYRIYWALERRLVTGAESSQQRYARIVAAHVTRRTRWLDLGCGHQLWPEWIPGQADLVRNAALVVGVDPDLGSVKRNAVVRHPVAGIELPFRDGAFNLVTANMVFEHLEHPPAVLEEIRRVLSPDGVCIVHTPNAWYWQTALARAVPQPIKNLLVRCSEGRAAGDVYPAHYRINTVPALRTLLPTAGLAADEVMLVNTSSAAKIVLLGPFIVLELMWMRMTQRPALRHHRSNIIAIVRPSTEPSHQVRRSAA
jgi:ubiquinone/menaquinone biosynthesis C-methylase UbiE